MDNFKIKQVLPASEKCFAIWWIESDEGAGCLLKEQIRFWALVKNMEFKSNAESLVPMVWDSELREYKIDEGNQVVGIWYDGDSNPDIDWGRTGKTEDDLQIITLENIPFI